MWGVYNDSKRRNHPKELSQQRLKKKLKEVFCGQKQNERLGHMSEKGRKEARIGTEEKHTHAGTKQHEQGIKSKRKSFVFCFMLVGLIFPTPIGGLSSVANMPFPTPGFSKFQNPRVCDVLAWWQKILPFLMMLRCLSFSSVLHCGANNQ